MGIKSLQWLNELGLGKVGLRKLSATPENKPRELTLKYSRFNLTLCEVVPIYFTLLTAAR